MKKKRREKTVEEILRDDPLGAAMLRRIQAGEQEVENRRATREGREPETIPLRIPDPDETWRLVEERLRRAGVPPYGSS